MPMIYHFHPLTGELSGEGEARLDPVEQKPLLPANATLIAPPEAQNGYARIFGGNAWAQVEDHRGKVLWTAEGEAQEITILGPLPAGLLSEKPVLPAYPDLQKALAAMLGWINEFASTLTAAMPHAEVRSLPVKAAAARALLAGEATVGQTEMLQAEADLTGEALADLAAEIAANADRDDLVNAKISGLRRSLKLQLEAAADPFAYETILEAGKQQALAMAAELGIAAPS